MTPKIVLSPMDVDQEFSSGQSSVLPNAVDPTIPDLWKQLFGKENTCAVSPRLSVKLDARNWSELVGPELRAYCSVQMKLDHKIAASLGASQEDIKLIRNYWNGVQSYEAVSFGQERFSQSFKQTLSEMIRQVRAAVRAPAAIRAAIASIKAPLSLVPINQVRWKLTLPVLLKAVLMEARASKSIHFSRGERALIAKDPNFAPFRARNGFRLDLLASWFGPLRKGEPVSTLLERHQKDLKKILERNAVDLDFKTVGIKSLCLERLRPRSFSLEDFINTAQFLYQYLRHVATGRPLEIARYRRSQMFDLSQFEPFFMQNPSQILDLFLDQGKYKEKFPTLFDVIHKDGTIWLGHMATPLFAMIEGVDRALLLGEDVHTAIDAVYNEHLQKIMTNGSDFLRDNLVGKWSLLYKILKVGTEAQEPMTFTAAERVYIHSQYEAWGPFLNDFGSILFPDGIIEPPRPNLNRPELSSEALYEQEIIPLFKTLSEIDQGVFAQGDVTINPILPKQGEKR